MDLYKYFSVLENKNKIMRFQDILYVTSFLMNSIKILHNNNIIHSDLKLENIVVNLNDQTEISELKIIDFDVGLFNIIPESLKPIPDKYLKAFNNKRPRGTRIYMIKDEQMSFKNDIFSLGVILLVILYKNTKLIISVSKKRAIEEAQENRKLILNLQSLIKKLNKLRDDIENNNTKFKLLDVISKFIHSTSNLTNFLNKNEINKFNSFKDLIIDCINTKFNINELKNLKYHNLV
jgi:serine/threonine protein kinase